jgi:hypothetical protein
MTKFAPFEGKPVASSAFEMPGAAGGLNAALGIDDMELEHEAEGTLVIAFKVTKVRFDPIKDTHDLRRVHVLKVTNAAQIDDDAVQELLLAQARRNEEAAGIQQLAYVDDPDDPDGDDEAGPE